MATDGGASETTEPASGSSTGTDVSLRDYIDHRVEALDHRVMQRFDLTDKALDAALAAAKEAVGKAETAAEKRFDSVNEFRGQLADQAGTFVRREVFVAEIRSVEAKIDANTDEITKLRETIGAQTGRAAGANAMAGYFIAAATLTLSLVIVVVNVVLR